MRVILVLLGLFVGGSSLAQESRTYTCGPDFHPSDLTFDEEGRMYSVSPGFGNDDLTEKAIDKVVYRPGNGFKNRSEMLHFHNSFTDLFALRSCTDIETPYNRVLSVIVTPLGQLCTNTFTGIELGIENSGSELVSTVACRDGRRWYQARFLDTPLELRSERRGNGLLLLGDKLWYASWGSPPDRQGRLTPVPVGQLEPLDLYRFYQDTTFIDAFPGIVELGNTTIPHFLAANEYENVFATTFTVDAEGRVRSRVVRLEGSEAQTVFSRDGLLTGIVALYDALWVADYDTGELLGLDRQGNVRLTFGGLDGPMGMAQAPNGDICVAEMLGGRIRCFSLQTLREGSRD